MRKILLFILPFALYAEDPQWLIDPTMGGKYIGATGCAKDMNNTKVQKNMALLRAKGSLSQNLNTQVEDKQHHEVTSGDDLFEEEFDFSSTQTTSSSLIIQEMADYHKNGLYCVWIVKK